MRLNLYNWEKENHFKAKDVAKNLGITEATYCNIKNGKTTPTLDFIYKFDEIYPGNNVIELMRKF